MSTGNAQQTSSATPIVPVESIAFGNAPLFCPNGNKEGFGNGVRITSDATIELAGEKDLSVKAGGVLFKERHSGSVSFYNDGEFATSFSRLLSNGSLVPLTKSTTVQAAEIRDAEDSSHLKDFLAQKGRETLKNGLAAGGELLQRVVNSGTGQKARGAADDLLAEGRAAASELTGNVRETLAELQVGGKLTSIADAARKRFGKLAWGKFGSGHKPDA